MLQHDPAVPRHEDGPPSVSIDTATVVAPARLHMGFLNLARDQSRRFGGLGVAIDHYSVKLTVTKAEQIACQGPDHERAARYARNFLTAIGHTQGVNIAIERAIPEHAGLGSGTQLALAIGQGISQLLALELPIPRIAALLERGIRSGVGIGTFRYGGFLVDGGHSDAAGIPPVIARCEFPSQWRLLLVEDRRIRGLNGGQERSAFSKLPPMRAALSAQLCRTLMLQVLPALHEHNFTDFSHGLGSMQRALGDYFAAKQGGGPYTSTAVGAVMNWLEGQGIQGVGQSSWGPTGFALFDSDAQAREVLARIGQNVDGSEHLHYSIAAAQNAGACLETRCGVDAAPAHETASAAGSSSRLLLTPTLSRKGRGG